MVLKLESMEIFYFENKHIKISGHLLQYFTTEALKK